MEQKDSSRKLAKPKRTSVKQDLYVVKFSEDDIIFKCTSKRIKFTGSLVGTLGQHVNCKWKDGRWYDAVIVKIGEESDGTLNMTRLCKEDTCCEAINTVSDTRKLAGASETSGIIDFPKCDMVTTPNSDTFDHSNYITTVDNISGAKSRMFSDVVYDTYNMIIDATNTNAVNLTSSHADTKSDAIDDTNNVIINDTNTYVISSTGSEIMIATNSDAVDDTNDVVIDTTNIELIIATNSDAIDDTKSDNKSHADDATKSDADNDTNSDAVDDTVNDVDDDTKSNAVDDTKSNAVDDTNDVVIDATNINVINPTYIELISTTNRDAVNDTKSDAIDNTNIVVIDATNAINSTNSIIATNRKKMEATNRKKIEATDSKKMEATASKKNFDSSSDETKATNSKKIDDSSSDEIVTNNSQKIDDSSSDEMDILNKKATWLDDLDRNITSEFFSDISDSDPDYVPDSEGDKDKAFIDICHKKYQNRMPCSSDSDEEVHLVANPKNKKKSSHHKFIEKTEIEGEMNSAQVPNAGGLCVGKSLNDGKKRNWNKTQFCIFCEKAFMKLPRHLMRKHKDEVEVKEVMCHSVGSPKRKALLAKLANKGNFNENCKSISNNSGKLVVRKRPVQDCNVKDYLPCKFCFGFFKKKYLWRHVQVCSCNLHELNGKVSKKHQQAGESLIPVSKSISSEMKTQLIAVMQPDQITLCVKNDPLILTFGEMLFKKYGKKKHQHQYVSQRMRELARLLLALRKDNPNLNSIEEVICPKMFDATVNAVRLATGYDGSSYEFGIPSLALRLGHSLNKLAVLVECSALKEGNSLKEKNAKKFLQLVTKQWSTAISAGALQTLQDNKRNKYQLLPVTEDIVKMTKYLNDRIEVVKQNVRETKSLYSWGEVCQLILSKVIMFNRRREGEASRVELSHFSTVTNQNAPSDMMRFLSPSEQQACSTFYRLEICGKRNRTVPLLFSPHMKASLDFLNETRSMVGVNRNNKYLFARACEFAETPYRGSDCLRTFAEKSGVSNVKSITSTNLRKQVATVSQIMDLKENELEQLANFMGHDISVHRNFYRLPQQTLQVAKVSKVLLTMENGQLEKLAGKNLDEFQVDYYEDINENGNPENVENEIIADNTSSDEEKSDGPELEEPLKILCNDPDSSQPRTSKARSNSKSSKQQNEEPADSYQLNRKRASIYTSRANRSSSSESDVPVKSKKRGKLTPNSETSQQRNLKARSNSKCSKKQDVCQKNHKVTCTYTSMVRRSSSSESDTPAKSKKGGTDANNKKRSWTKEETEAVMNSELNDYIKRLKVPGFDPCSKCKNANADALSTRSIRNIKDFVRNKITQRLRLGI